MNFVKLLHWNGPLIQLGSYGFSTLVHFWSCLIAPLHPHTEICRLEAKRFLM